MYTVEQASILEIPELLEIAVQFWNESPTYKQRPLDINKVRAHLQSLILYPSTGCLFVCKDEHGQILGGFAGGIQAEWFGHSVMSFDYCLFVRPESRGSRAAYLLIKQFIAWSQEQGADWIQCGTATKINTDRTIKFYEKMGFIHTGSFLEMKV